MWLRPVTFQLCDSYPQRLHWIVYRELRDAENHNSREWVILENGAVSIWPLPNGRKENDRVKKEKKIIKPNKSDSPSAGSEKTLRCRNWEDGASKQATWKRSRCSPGAPRSEIRPKTKRFWRSATSGKDGR